MVDVNTINDFHLSEINSTNDFARLMLSERKENIVVSSSLQTLGRGRSDHKWSGLKDENLYFSLGLYYNEEVSLNHIVLLQAVGCLAVKDSILDFVPNINVKLKYPNDVHAKVDDEFAKISGILVEHAFIGSRCESSVIGIGVNLLQEHFSDIVGNRACSLVNFGVKVSPIKFKERLKINLNKYLNMDDSKLFNIWKMELNIIGKIIKVVGNDEYWTVELFDEDGTLTIRNINNYSIKKINDGDSIRYSLD